MKKKKEITIKQLMIDGACKEAMRYIASNVKETWPISKAFPIDNVLAALDHPERSEWREWLELNNCNLTSKTEMRKRIKEMEAEIADMKKQLGDK